MPRTLYARLSLVLVLILASIGLIYIFISISATRHYLQEIDQEVNRELSQNLVADRNLVEAGRINEKALQETFQEYMVINPSIEIYLLDLDGKILSYSADPGKVKRKQVSLEPIHAFLSGEKEFPLLGDDPRSHDRRKAFSVTPVPSAEHPEGYLYVVLRGEQYDQVEQFIRESYFLHLSGWTITATLLFSLLAGLILFRFLTLRLNRLSTLMDDFRTSGFTRLSPYISKAVDGDEIDKLGANFNMMSELIIEQLKGLKGQDALRRELVANVSHDLRTPLAILHGYLETLKLKGNELDDETRAHYLKLALDNSERLGKLIAELFELAKLDAHETKPVFESFPPTDLFQDVLNKFKLRANQKNVHLHLHADEGLPFVYADIALIERALENLIENAIKHTPPDGNIYLTLEKQGENVVIKVADSGSGIAEQDIPYIFDRYYQANKNRDNVDHAGLGLAIVKRILELHGSDIQVASEARKGATFRFSLPLQTSS